MSVAATIKTVSETLNARLDAIASRSMLYGASDAARFVIQTSEGLYLKRLDTRFVVVGIEQATAMLESEARAIAPTITNGHGERAWVSNIRAALRVDAARVRATLAELDNAAIGA